MMLYVLFCVVLCVSFYGPFCHGAPTLDISTFFTTFFIWTSLQIILYLFLIYFKQAIDIFYTNVIMLINVVLSWSFVNKDKLK